MHPTILALAIPAFQDALFPRDSDVDDFLAKRFPAVLLQSNTLTKAGKIFVLVRDVPQDQLAKAMEEQGRRQVQASITAKWVAMPREEAKELAKRALVFKTENGRLPDINSPDAWEKRMAEGVAALARYRAEEKAREVGVSG